MTEFCNVYLFRGACQRYYEAQHQKMTDTFPFFLLGVNYSLPRGLSALPSAVKSTSMLSIIFHETMNKSNSETFFSSVY